MRIVASSLLVAAVLLLPRVSGAEDELPPPDVERRIQDLVAREPHAAEVREAARRHAGLDPALARSWARRARLAALLPQVTTRFLRARDRDEGLDLDADKADRSLDVGDELVLEVRATWDLGRLVFDPSEIRAAREGLRLAAERQHLESEVTRLYYQRRRAQIEWIVSPPADPAEQARREIEMNELTANLDVLTGGWFTREIARMEAE